MVVISWFSGLLIKCWLDFVKIMNLMFIKKDNLEIVFVGIINLWN